MRVSRVVYGFGVAVLVSLSGLAWGGSAHAEDGAAKATPLFEVGDLWTREQLLGDPGGVRSGLAKYGVNIGLRLSQYYQDVASGGVKRKGEYGGTLDYRLNVDAHKLGLWKGLAFGLHARTRFGKDVSAYAGSFALPNAGLLMPLPGNYVGTNVTGATISQTVPFIAGREANLTLGKLDDIDLVTGFFPHVGFGQEGFQNVNALVSALPWFGAVQGLSVYGGVASTINQKYALAETGFLAVGTENVSDQWNSLSGSFKDGVWLAGFHRFFWELEEKMGYFMVFGGYSTKDQASNDRHDFVVIPGQGIRSTEQKKPWDIAAYVYQDIWQSEDNPDRKVSLFIGGTLGPDNPQFAQSNIFGSVEAFGLLESRPHDRMGASLWFNGLSANFKDLVSPVASLRNTWGTEIYYNFAITPWAHLTADLQLVMNERQADDIAIIPGGRLVIDF